MDPFTLAIIGALTSTALGAAQGQTDTDELFRNAAFGGLTGGLGGFVAGGAPVVGEIAKQSAGQVATQAAGEAAKQGFAQSAKDIAKNVAIGTGTGMLQQKQVAMNQPSQLLQGAQQQPQLQQLTARRQPIPTAGDLMAQRQQRSANPFGQRRGYYA